MRFGTRSLYDKHTRQSAAKHQTQWPLFTPRIWSLIALRLTHMSGLLKRPAQSVAKTAKAQGLMANPKPKHEDDDTVKTMLAALATYCSGELHE